MILNGKAEADGEVEPKAESTPTSTGKPRSETPYPYFGLGRAIDILQAVRRAGGSEAANSEVMRELKVAKTADRLWAYGVPATIQFGLIERIGRGDAGRIKVTELGMRIALPSNPDEERAAKVAAFRTPELYSKLLERFAGGPMPAKEGLGNLLHREYKIVESMAQGAAEAFLDSLKVAEIITASGTLPMNDAVAPQGADAPRHSKSAAEISDDRGPPPNTQTITVPADFVVYKCKISGGRVINIPLPPTFTKNDVRRLHAFLETQIDDEPEGSEGGHS